MVETLNNLLEQLFAQKQTQLFLPSWWVRTFEHTFLHENSPLDSLNLSIKSQITPPRRCTELVQLSLLLSDIQDKILRQSKNENHIVIDPQKYAYLGPLKTSGTQKFLIGKPVQDFSNLKLVIQDPHHSKSRLMPLFTHEEWTHITPDKAMVNLELSPEARELILGYIEPYTELERSLSHSFELETLLNDQGPLSLWRSIWFDFQGVEQILFLRLEKAVQWDFNLLHLEGGFGLSFNALFDQIDSFLPKGEASPLPESSFVKRLRFLMRLGQKMIDHGLFCPRVSDQFLAFGNENMESGPKIVWQVAEDRFRSEEIENYSLLVSSFFVKTLIPASLNKILRLFIANLPDYNAISQLASEGWERIAKCEMIDAHRPVSTLSHNKLLLPHLLFTEWGIRQLPGHKFPLPASIVSSEAGRLAKIDPSYPIEERFKAFVRTISKSQDYNVAIEKLPLCSLITPANKSIPTFKQDLTESCLSNRSRVNLHDVNHDANKNSPIKPQSIETSSPKQPIHPKSIDAAINKSNTTMSNIILTRMRKLAADELKKMQNSNKGGYQALKSQYLSSLDETGRKLVLDVQKRMQPELFNDHLNHRLVRFMVENPSSWRSQSRQETLS